MDTKHILLAAHDPNLLAEIQRALEPRREFAVHRALGGQALLAELARAPFDLLVVEHPLADADAPTLMRQAQATCPDAIVVLMTAMSATEIQAARAATSSHHFVSQPIAATEIAELIGAIFPPEPPAANSTAPVVLKVILGGDANVGKTSLIQRYCYGNFEPMREMTIGVDFHLYTVHIEKTPVRLIVWDFGGQERFAFARQAFYRGTHAAALVFDASNRTSFFNLMRWWHETREFLPDVPVLLLANKTDLARQITFAEAQRIAHAWQVPLFESSCAQGIGVAAFFEALATAAWQHAQATQFNQTGPNPASD